MLVAVFSLLLIRCKKKLHAFALQMLILVSTDWLTDRLSNHSTLAAHAHTG